MIRIIEKPNNTCIVCLQGNLDVSVQEELKKDLSSKLPESALKIILDFKRVEFIDSSCLGALVGLARNFKIHGGKTVLVNLSDEVLSIFQITRLDKIFPIFESIDQAVESL